MKQRNHSIELFCSGEESEINKLRANLRAALQSLSIIAAWKEYYPSLSNLPRYLKHAQGLSLIIDETVKWEHLAGISIPTTEEISTMILGSKPGKVHWKRMLRNHLSFLAAMLIAFFPKCPFCWAAYMSLFSAFGLGSIPYKPWLLPVFIVLLFVNVFSLYQSRKRHGYSPLLLALLGALLITLNRFYWSNTAILAFGSLCLVTASLWNTLPKRMADSLKYYFRLRL